MKIKIKYLMLISFIVLLMFSVEVQARITTSDPTVNSGENVTITINSQEKVTSGAINVSSDGGLTFVSVSGGTANGTLVAFSGTENKTTGIAKYTFKAPSVTETKTFKVVFTAKDMADLDGEPVADSSATATVTVKAIETPNNCSSTNNNTGNNTGTNTGTTTPEKPKTKSTNAYLSTLGVTPKEYDFSGFKRSTMTYSVTVPNDVDSLKVLYKTADSGATVKVTGNSGFEVGSNNKITIKVTAEDGKTNKIYTIKVTKLAAEEEKPGNVIEDQEGLYLTSLSIKGIDIYPEFSKDIYAYTATLEKDNITDVEVNAKANKANANIEISGNTNLVTGENIINIVVKETDNMLQKVYQITLIKNETLVDVTNGNNSSMNNLISNIKDYFLIAIVSVVLIILVVIVLIIMLKKENKRLYNITMEDENTEYNLYKNELEDEKTYETETKNKRKRSKRGNGRHSK